MQSLPHINSVLNNNSLPTADRDQARSLIESSILSIAADIRSSLPSDSAATLLPTDSTSLWNMYGSPDGNSDKLQHKITAASIKKTSEQPRYHSAASLSASYSAARLPLTTLPEEPQLCMTNSEVHAMVKHRIAAITPINAPLHCRCDSTKQIRDTQHPHVCPLVRKNAVYTRHQFILRTLDACARLAGAITTTSPPINFQRTANEGNIIPDLFINTGTSKYMIDVSIIYPAADSHSALASTAQCAAATKRENEKREKYDRIAIRNGFIFVPFVIESFGAIGKCADQLIKELANCTNDASNSSYFKRRLSIALQRGNALIAQEGAWLMK